MLRRMTGAPQRLRENVLSDASSKARPAVRKGTRFAFARVGAEAAKAAGGSTLETRKTRVAQIPRRSGRTSAKFAAGCRLVRGIGPYWDISMVARDLLNG